MSDLRWEYAKERMPNRAKWDMITIFCSIIGGILFISIVGLPLSIPFIIVGLYAAFRSFRYPIVKMTCPVCRSKVRIEKEVEQFHCLCYTHLKKENGELKKVE
ncbi:hypothetical protein [Melghirimyces algeriensis]|uniref:hypothetical protein n=1 Tax=Melghirimyces algeriensis TaxID=910412 RepID=UPI00115BCFEE|nr:hypothetical protein [Melghirimyces algeriensis]